MKTKHFQIIFKTFAVDDKGTAIPTEGFIRIIAAKNRDTAVRIAQAMKGEEIDMQEYLDDATIVEETGEDYDIGSYDNGETWKRVLKNLGWREKDVEWIYSDEDKDEIVGLNKK